MPSPWGPKKGAALMGGVVVKKSQEVQGGWFEDQSFSETTDPFNAHATKITEYRFKEEPAFYTDRLVEYQENEWYSWLVDQLNSLLFSGYTFDGPGAEDVRKFFDETCPDARDQIMMMGLNVIREGTGGLRKIRTGNGRLVQIYHINGRLIRLKRMDLTDAISPPRNVGPEFKIKFDANDEPMGASLTDHSDFNSESEPGALDSKVVTRMTISGVADWRADFLEWPRLKPEDYKHDEVALCRLKQDAWSPYGIAFGRSCFHVIKAMRSLNRDLIAAIKRLSASILVFKGDVGHVDGDANKRAALLAASKAFKDIDSATTGVIAIDSKNVLTYPEGDAGERLIPIMGLLEPVMSALLLNFLVALGVVEQTGANKSLIAKQEIRAGAERRALREMVARFFQTQIFPEITDKPCSLIFDADLDPEFWMTLWQTGAVSRERVHEEFNIIDKGETYSTDLQADVKKAGMRDSNDDDASTPGRKGGQGDTSVTKAV